MLLPVISWRNVWRNPTRSLVVIIAVTLGVWALVFLLSFTQGMVKSYIDRTINTQTSHLQIHHPDFKENLELLYTVDTTGTILDRIHSYESVEAATMRTVTSGMLSSAHGTRGVQITGIDPESEARVTRIDQFVKKGTFLSGGGRLNPVLISTRMADDLQLKPGSKVVLTFQDIDGDITAGAFRIGGLFNTGDARYDERYVFVLQKDMNELIGLPPAGGHEVAIKLHRIDRTEAMEDSLASVFPSLQVETYKEISPDLELFSSQLQANIIIMIAIVMLALIFGIINTMLMSVLERFKELGMLMAIGMNKGRVFFMVLLETVLLTSVGVPFGLIFGYFTVSITHQYGIDLSAFASGLEKFGLANIIRPELDVSVYWQIALAVALTAILAAIYPAWKAIRLKPVEALRKI